MQLICMLFKMKMIIFAKKKIRQSVKKWQLERRSPRKEIHLPAKSQDCDTLQFGNICKKDLNL